MLYPNQEPVLQNYFMIIHVLRPNFVIKSYNCFTKLSYLMIIIDLSVFASVTIWTINGHSSIYEWKRLNEFFLIYIAKLKYKIKLSLKKVLDTSSSINRIYKERENLRLQLHFKKGIAMINIPVSFNDSEVLYSLFRSYSSDKSIHGQIKHVVPDFSSFN